MKNDNDGTSVPQLHLYAQYSQHMPAKIVGTREALERLHKMLSIVIGDTRAEKSVSEIFQASDREEYEVLIRLVPGETHEEFDGLPYRSWNDGWDGESV